MASEKEAMTVGENVVLKLLACLALPYFFLLRLGFNVGRPPLEAHEPRTRKNFIDDLINSISTQIIVNAPTK